LHGRGLSGERRVGENKSTHALRHLSSVTLNQRRALSPPNQEFYRDEHLFVDLLTQVVTLDSEILALTRMEYRLLALLVTRAGEVVPRSILLKLTGPLDVHLWRLRKKLGKYGNQYIEAVTGVGYRFRPAVLPRN
jgi:DNA-binding response OmpR family regulator